MKVLALLPILLITQAVNAWSQDATAQMQPAAIREALDITGVRPGDLVYDLGCGEARILVEAGTRYRARVLGIEIDPAIYRRAVANCRAAGLRSWKVIQGDATHYSLEAADVVTVYLYHDVLERIAWDTLKPGARVVSYQHPIPGLPCGESRCRINGQDHVFYTYRKPK